MVKGRERSDIDGKFLFSARKEYNRRSMRNRLGDVNSWVTTLGKDYDRRGDAESDIEGKGKRW